LALLSAALAVRNVILVGVVGIDALSVFTAVFTSGVVCSDQGGRVSGGVWRVLGNGFLGVDAEQAEAGVDHFPCPSGIANIRTSRFFMILLET